MSRSLRLASAGLVAAAVLAITACGSSTSSGGVAGAIGTPGTSAAPSAAAASASAEASPSGSGTALNQAFLQFREANGSGITGGAILTDLGNDQTAVTIGVVAAGMTDPLPANLTPGDCATLSTGGGASGSPAPSAGASAAASAAPSAAATGSAEPSGSAVPLNPGAVVQLGDLAAGSSNTVVNIGLDGLLSQPYAAVIYKAAGDTTVIACADVKK